MTSSTVQESAEALRTFAESQPLRSADRAATVRQLMLKYGIYSALEEDITEFAINAPGGYWVEDRDGWRYTEAPSLTMRNLTGLATAIGVFNRKPLDVDSPIQSLTLPDGERTQIVLPPVCLDNHISMTIRKPSSQRFTIGEYSKSGRLCPVRAYLGDDIFQWEKDLLNLMEAGRLEEFFSVAADHRLNIVTVGGTGSGKTTFSKAVIDLYPANRRIFTLEDAHELQTPNHKNSVHLLFSPAITAKTVLASCMRMKPDHIFLTELRGDETWDYLMALKSGHPGSVTSIHANDCRGALAKIASYIKQSVVGQTLDMSYIMSEVLRTIDVVLYFEKTHLKEIYYDPYEKLRLLKGKST